MQNGDAAELCAAHGLVGARDGPGAVEPLAGSSDLPVIVGGDFNMPADDSTMAALRLSFRFAFEEAGWGYGYTRPSRSPGSGSTTS